MTFNKSNNKTLSPLLTKFGGFRVKVDEIIHRINASETMFFLKMYHRLKTCLFDIPDNKPVKLAFAELFMRGKQQ